MYRAIADVLPAQATALVRTHPGLNQRRGNLAKKIRIFRFQRLPAA